MIKMYKVSIHIFIFLSSVSLNQTVRPTGLATVSILRITIFSAPNQEFNFLMKEQKNKWKTTEWMDTWMNEG